MCVRACVCVCVCVSVFISDIIQNGIYNLTRSDDKDVLSALNNINLPHARVRASVKILINVVLQI